MALIIDSSVWEAFPGLQIVVAAGDGLENASERPSAGQFLQQVQEGLRKGWGYPNPQSHPHIAAWREAYDYGGALLGQILSPSGFRPGSRLQFYTFLYIKNWRESGEADADLKPFKPSFHDEEHGTGKLVRKWRGWLLLEQLIPGRGRWARYRA